MKRLVVSIFFCVLVNGAFSAGNSDQKTPQPPLVSAGARAQFLSGGYGLWRGNPVSARIYNYNSMVKGPLSLSELYEYNIINNYKILSAGQRGTEILKFLIHSRTDSFTTSYSGIGVPPFGSVAPLAKADTPADDYVPYENLLKSNALLGFGRNTAGGQGGKICLVNNLSDSGSGSLRGCAGSQGTKWILFNVSGNILLESPLFIHSNKTIDGRGQQVTISGYGLRMHGVHNIIVHNIKIIGGFGKIGDNTLNNDAVQIWKGSRDIWLDHLTLANWPDELLDVSHASTDITVSWNHFAYHPDGRNYGALFGSSNSDTQDIHMRITLHHNYFDHMTERGPHARFGKFHFFNNYSHGWKNRAGTSVMEAELLSENNIFVATRERDAFHTEKSAWAPRPGKLRSVNDLMINGAYHTTERLPQSVFNAGNYYLYSLETPDSELGDKIRRYSGWQASPAP